MTFIPEFKASKPYTIGVEAEFQLLDDKTFDLASVAPEILAKIPADYKERIKPEFIQSMVEVATGVCHDISEVENDLRDSIGLLSKLAAESGCHIFASSLHPFADYNAQKLTPGKRYAALMEELQLAGRRLITQGLHVHIGLADRETLIKVCDGMRPYLPLLLAATTSSPYYGGEDTGFCSYRSRLLDALSRSGLPYTFRSWEHFNILINDLNRAGLIEDIRDIWWDVRPHPDLGTVEVRICDLPVRFDELLAVVALIQALVKKLAESPPVNSFPRLEIISSNKWQAARHGLAGKFVDLDNSSEFMIIKDALRNVVTSVGSQARDLQVSAYVGKIESIIENGTGAAKKRRLMAAGNDFKAMIAKLAGDFWK